MASAILVTSLTRHFGGGAAAAEAFMGALSARIGRPVSWDEREDAPLLREEVADFDALVRAAVALDGAADAGAIEAARLRLRRTRFPHLVRAGSIFLPIGFDRPIDLRRSPLGDGVVGSASRLLAELEQVEDELASAARVPPRALAPAIRMAREALRLRLPLLLLAPPGP